MIEDLAHDDAVGEERDQLALATVSADLDGHRRLAVDLRKQVEGAEREQARLQDELNRARQEIDGKRSEIERASRHWPRTTR